MAKFDEEQLEQLQTIIQGERFYTEQLIKKHTKPILDKVTKIEQVQQEDRKDAREDVDSVVTQYVELDKRMTRTEKVLKLKPLVSMSSRA